MVDETAMAEGDSKGTGRFKSEVHRRQHKKNLAVLAALIAFGILIFLITVARLSGG